MKVTATPAPKSSVLLEIEVPADQLDRAVRDAVGRLSRRTRVAGFRPGKAPRPILERVLGPGAVLDEAVEQLVQDSYREAIVEQEIVPLTNADVEVVEAIEGKPLRFKATVQVRPEVELGDYQNFKFRPEIDTVDEAKVDKVVDELRDQNATLAAVEERGAKDGDWAVIGFAGTKDGVPFDGGTTERMPLIIGEDRLIPGFEANLVGLKAGESTTFDITFPDDYPEESLAGQQVQFAVDLKELREKVLPEADDAFAQSMGDYADLAALKADVAERLRRDALDRARHEFSDKIIDYAVANSTIELPAILVDQEVEVMHDEFRQTLARQGITRARVPQGDRARPRRTCTPSSARAPSSASRCCSCSRRSRRPRASTSATTTSRRRSSSRASATPATRRPCATSSPSAAATSSAARCAGRRSSRRSSTAGSPPTPSIRRCRTSRTTSPVRGRGPRGRGRRIHRRHRSGLHPGRDRRGGR